MRLKAPVLLRVGLDDSNVTAVIAALRAIHAMIYSESGMYTNTIGELNRTVR